MGVLHKTNIGLDTRSALPMGNPAVGTPAVTVVRPQCQAMPGAAPILFELAGVPIPSVPSAQSDRRTTALFRCSGTGVRSTDFCSAPTAGPSSRRSMPGRNHWGSDGITGPGMWE